MTLNPIFIQSEDIVHYIGIRLNTKSKTRWNCAIKRIGTTWKAKFGDLFIMPSAVSTGFRAIISITMKIYPVCPMVSGIAGVIRGMTLRPSRLRQSKLMEKKP